MPHVIIPIAIAAAGATLGVAIGVTTVTAAVISVGVTALAAGAGYLLSKGQSVGGGLALASEGPQAAPVNGQRNIVVREAIPPRRYVYGSTRVGGALIFQDNDNPTLYMMAALSDGEVNALSAFYIGDQLVPLDGVVPAAGTTYDGRITTEFRTGTAAQAASAMLLAAFPTTLDSTFKQSGVATLAVALDWGDDATMHNGLWGTSISPSVVIEGVKVVDPRVTGYSPTAATARTYSATPPLCLAHALTNAWDLALEYTDLDWQSFGDAATDCEATVTYSAESREIFELAGVLQSGAGLASQIEGMLSSFGGTLYFADGVYKVRADKARSSVWTITDADIFEIGEFTHEGESADVPNAIKARYSEAGEDGVETTTPTYEHAAFATESPREILLSLPFTPRTHSAQILAFRELTRARDGRALSITVSDAGNYLEPFDVVTIASVAADWLNGDFQVIQVDMSNPGTNLQLRGYDPDVYDDPTTYLQ